MQRAGFGKAKMFRPPATQTLSEAANKFGQEHRRLFKQFKCQTTMTAAGIKNLHRKSYYKTQGVGKSFCKGLQSPLNCFGQRLFLSQGMANGFSSRIKRAQIGRKIVQFLEKCPKTGQSAFCPSRAVQNQIMNPFLNLFSKADVDRRSGNGGMAALASAQALRAVAFLTSLAPFVLR
jgi:hypothetical protein